MTLLAFESVPIRENGESLVDLRAYNFVLEPVYFKQGLTSDSKMFLRKSVADMLANIQKNLVAYRFKIWDGFRPRAVQHAIYERTWNALAAEHPDWDHSRLTQEVGVFVTDAADAQRIPPHTTGGTVDLTLVDARDRELDMGTVFDHFGAEAAALYFERAGSDEIVRANRRLLRDAMAGAGFAVDPDEWWHFDYGNQKWALQTGQSEAFFGEAIL